MDHDGLMPSVVLDEPSLRLSFDLLTTLIVRKSGRDRSSILSANPSEVHCPRGWNGRTKGQPNPTLEHWWACYPCSQTPARIMAELQIADVRGHVAPSPDGLDRARWLEDARDNAWREVGQRSLRDLGFGQTWSPAGSREHRLAISHLRFRDGPQTLCDIAPSLQVSLLTAAFVSAASR
jgi:hypothetical protein